MNRKALQQLAKAPLSNGRFRQINFASSGVGFDTGKTFPGHLALESTPERMQRARASTSSHSLAAHPHNPNFNLLPPV